MRSSVSLLDLAVEAVSQLLGTTPVQQAQRREAGTIRDHFGDQRAHHLGPRLVATMATTVPLTQLVASNPGIGISLVASLEREASVVLSRAS